MNKNMALTFLKGQLPSLIEKFEPELEKSLVEMLQSIKKTNSTEFELFLTNWRKLNGAIEASAVMTGGAEPEPAPAPAPAPEPVPEPAPEPAPEPEPTPEPVPDSTPPPESTTAPESTSIIQKIKDAFGVSSEPQAGGVRKLFAPNSKTIKGGRRRRGAKQHRKRTQRVKDNKE